MDRSSPKKLCDAQEALCSSCESDVCEKCIVANLRNDAYNKTEKENDDASYTAIVYEEDSVVTADLTTYDSKEDAINFAETRNWDEVVNDHSGEVVWRRNTLLHKHRKP